jgi:hypothetical protein
MMPIPMFLPIFDAEMVNVRDVAGKRYFSCAQGCGVMVSAATLEATLRAAPPAAGTLK